MKKYLLAVVVAILAASGVPAHAQIRITEVTPWGSSTSNPAIPYLSDWFELTNFGATAVDITGWRMDDSSPTFGTSVALTGITSIAPGESVIFLEDPTKASLFLSTWFGGSLPVGLQIGGYAGSGVGLSQSGDAVNIFDATASHNIVASVLFGAADGTSPFQTFDNAAGLNNTTISTLSAAGTNGAFVAANDANEIGSPGRITAVPEPQTYAMMLAGLTLLGAFVRKHRR
jgi:hypothetical protein